MTKKSLPASIRWLMDSSSRALSEIRFGAEAARARSSASRRLSPAPRTTSRQFSFRKKSRFASTSSTPFCSTSRQIMPKMGPVNRGSNPQRLRSSARQACLPARSAAV